MVEREGRKGEVEWGTRGEENGTEQKEGTGRKKEEGERKVGCNGKEGDETDKEGVGRGK